MVNLIASYTPGSNRSDDLRSTGCDFIYTGATGLLVTALGAWKIVGMTGNIIMRLTNDTNTLLLATSTVNITAGTAGQFNYAACTPFPLVNGAIYHLVSTIPLGQSYPDTASLTANDATSISGIFDLPAVGGGNGSQFGSNNMYAGVDMIFGAAGAPSSGMFFMG